MNFPPSRTLVAGACFLAAALLFAAWAILARGSEAIPVTTILFGDGGTPGPTVRSSFTRVARGPEDLTQTAAAAVASATPVPQTQPDSPTAESTVFMSPTPLYPGVTSPLERTEFPTPSPVESPTPELTPVPTDTPAPPPPSPTPTPTRGPIRITKLGLGVYASGGGFLPALDQARPSIILLMDPAVDFAQEVRRRFPKSFIIGRIYSADQRLDNPAQRGTDFADRVAVTAVPLKGTVDAWMSYNEVVSKEDLVGLINYNTFQVAFAHRLQDFYGIDAVAANDGPRALPVEYYVKYYADAIRVSHYFGLHIYPNPDIKSLRDPNATDQVFFYRKIRAALDAARIKAGPFIVTEINLYDGWRDIESENDMGYDLTWVADQTNADSYMLGIVVFGIFSDNNRWGKYAVDGSNIVNIMGDYNTVH